jgi:polyisoprenoid-binding protein YceI
MRTLLLVTALLAASSSSLVLAQTGKLANPDPGAVAAGRYEVEPGHTRVQFTVSHMGVTDWYGDLTNASGTLSIDPRDVAAATVDISIPTASVSTTNATLDGELRGAQWFDAERFPTIRFVSTKIVRKGARAATITGNLTFHGVTKRVTLQATFNAAGIDPISKHYTVGFNASTAILRSDFGVKTYVPLIGDKTELRISASFVRAAN